MKEKFKNIKISKKKLIVIIVAVVMAIIIIPSGIYCIVQRETPAQMFTDIFTSTEKQLIGKWQNDTGVSAYEFYDDGTYDSYISTFSFSGTYTLEGNKLTLASSYASGSVVYKVSVTDTKLSMTLVEENGADSDDKEKTEFKRVNHINTKSLNDLLDNALDTTSESE